MRTHVLVAMTSAMFALPFAMAHASLEALSRVAQGVAVGISFVGAGCVMKGEGKVRGLTTASSIAVTAALGFACSFAPVWMVALGAFTAWVVLARFERWDQD